MVTRQPLERTLETFFTAVCKEYGVTSLKLALRHSRGWPDRIVILKNGRVVWAELKTTTGKLSPMQSIVHRNLQALNHQVEVLRTKDDIREFIKGLL